MSFYGLWGLWDGSSASFRSATAEDKAAFDQAAFDYLAVPIGVPGGDAKEILLDNWF